MKTVTVVIDDSRDTYRLTDRVADVVAWLAHLGDSINSTPKGKIQIDYAGGHITKSFLQIEEGGGKS